MKLLIDECLPRALKRYLAGHECRTVQEMGWSGTQNGELLSISETEFDVFVTIDQGIRYEQNLANWKLAILVLNARSNQIEDLKPIIPAALAELRCIQPGRVITIGE